MSEGIYRVDPRLPIDELGDLFDLELEDDDVDSVGGLLTKALGRLPVLGSTVHVAGLVLTAERTDGRRRRLSAVRVERDPDAARTPQESEGPALPGVETRETENVR